MKTYVKKPERCEAMQIGHIDRQRFIVKDQLGQNAMAIPRRMFDRYKVQLGDYLVRFTKTKTHQVESGKTVEVPDSGGRGMRTRMEPVMEAVTADHTTITFMRPDEFESCWLEEDEDEPAPLAASGGEGFEKVPAPSSAGNFP